MDSGVAVRQTRSLPVPEGLDGLRLDQAVARLFGLSRTPAALRDPAPALGEHTEQIEDLGWAAFQGN